MKANLKVHCNEQGYKGLIADDTIYELVKNGETDWKDYIKARLKTVEIPYKLFLRLMELDRGMTKCTHPEGLTIKPDGIHEMDACVYKVKEVHRNVTVTVSECTRCGSVDISWERQEDTEDEIVEE